MKENLCINNFVLKCIKKDLWTHGSFCSLNKDTAKITPVLASDNLLDIDQQVSKNSRRCESFAYRMDTEESGFFDDFGKITIKGALLKKGRKGGLKKRFFYIKGSLMYYYLDSKSPVPRGIMYLPGKLLKKDVFRGKP